MRGLVPAIAALAIVAPSGAHAATNYFVCTVTSEGRESEYRVTTDEDKGEVTYEVVSNGNIFKKPALFTADSVIWGDPPDPIARAQFTISRIDLSFEISLSIGGKVTTPRKGKCVKQEAPKRAF